MASPPDLSVDQLEEAQPLMTMESTDTACSHSQAEAALNVAAGTHPLATTALATTDMPTLGAQETKAPEADIPNQRIGVNKTTIQSEDSTQPVPASSVTATTDTDTMMERHQDETRSQQTLSTTKTSQNTPASEIPPIKKESHDTASDIHSIPDHQPTHTSGDISSDHDADTGQHTQHTTFHVGPDGTCHSGLTRNSDGELRSQSHNQSSKPDVPVVPSNTEAKKKADAGEHLSQSYNQLSKPDVPVVPNNAEAKKEYNLAQYKFLVGKVMNHEDRIHEEELRKDELSTAQLVKLRNRKKKVANLKIELQGLKTQMEEEDELQKDSDDDDDDISDDEDLSAPEDGMDSDFDPDSEGYDDSSDDELLMSDDERLRNSEARTEAEEQSTNKGANQTQANIMQDRKIVEHPKKAKGTVSTFSQYWNSIWTKLADEDKLDKVRSGMKRPTPFSIPSIAMKPPKKQKNDDGKAQTFQDMLLQTIQSGDPIAQRAALGDLPGIVNSKTSTDKRIKRIQEMYRIAESPRKLRQLDRAILEQATLSFGHGKVEPTGRGKGEWQLNKKVYHLSSSLPSFQLIGVRWMLGRETCPMGVKGGILADEMGLGKTIQLLAVIAANRATKEQVKAGQGATLVVAKANLISQWMSEADHHLSFNYKEWKFHHYRKAEDKPTKAYKRDLERKDIVFASYEEVHASYKLRPARKRGKKSTTTTGAQGEEYGFLHKIEWHRVILDEAHSIKDHTTPTSKACCALKSKYRWAVSGTPIMNSVMELFSYFKFLGFEWAQEYSDFVEEFGDIENEAVAEKLYAIVTSYQLRRRVSDKFFGKHIMEIPTTHAMKDIWVDLSPEDQKIQAVLRSAYSRACKAKKLREAEASDEVSSAAPGARKGQATLQLYSALRELSSHRLLINTDVLDHEGHIVTKGTQGKEENQQIDSCRWCGDVPDRLPKTKCGHGICVDCFTGAVNKAREAGEDGVSCVDCHQPMLLEEPFSDTESSKGSNSSMRHHGGKKQARSFGDDVRWIQPSAKRKAHKQLYESDSLSIPPAHSAKTKAALERVHQNIAEAEDDKQIIYTQWVDMGRIMGRFLQQDKIKFLYYFGEMPMNQRDETIMKFRKDPEIKVLIMSMKCAVGLNLTCANRIIMMDLWFNNSVEHQAFARVVRIGQKKPVHSIRILGRDSFDQDIIEIQERKEEEIKKIYPNAKDMKATVTMADIERHMADDLGSKERGNRTKKSSRKEEQD